MGLGDLRLQQFPLILPIPEGCHLSVQGLKPLESGSIDTFVKANLLPGISKVNVREGLGG